MLVSSTPGGSIAASLTIERASGALAIRAQIIDVAVSRMKLSEQYFGGVRARFPRLYDLWRGTWTGRFHPHRNNVHIPLIFSAIWADAARKAATSLNMWPIVTFLGYGPDDMPIARKREALISAQMKDDNAFIKQVNFMVAADLYGVGVMQVGWKREENMRIVEVVDRMPISGKVVKAIKKGKVISFDGPVSEALDLLDCFPQPGHQSIDTMKYFIRRSFLDLDDLRALAAARIFDQGEVSRLEREGGVGSQIADQESMIRRFAVRAGMDDESIRWMDKYNRPVEIIEMWTRDRGMPSELCPDGVTGRVITIANRRYLMRNRPNPFWHGQLPFLAWSPTPDPHYFYAVGKAEIVEKLQIVGNRYINQSLDAADLIIDPQWFYDRGANLNTRNLYSRPGRFIPVDGNPSQVVAPLQTPLQGLTTADQKLAQIREYTQMGTGIVDDAVQGLQGADRQTAREFIGRREASGTRLLLESRLYEEMLLEPMANMFVALDKQFLKAPVEVLILGDGVQLDPVTQQPIPGSREHLDDYDLVPNYAARAMGASSALSKGMKQQNLIQLLQAMASPLGQAVAGQVNAMNFWRSIFREFEVPNINEIFQQNPQLAAIQQGAGGPNAPTSGQIVQGAPLPGVPPQGAPQPPPGMGFAAGERGQPLGHLPGMTGDMQHPLTPGVAA